MIKKTILLSLPIAVCSIFQVSGQNAQPSIIDTNARAMVLAPGVISTPAIEAVASFKPDGNTVFFAQGTLYMTVCFSKRVNGEWIKPKVASFSGRWGDWDPFLSPDGKRLFFVSSRPLEGVSPDKLKKRTHLWYVDQVAEDQWSAPHFLDAPFNLDSADNYGPTVSSAGTLFFCSEGRDGHPGMNGYSAKWLGDHYDTPKLLTINGEKEVMDPFIAPDESYIIFASGNDLYISFHQGNAWSASQNLGPQVNNGDSNYDPTVSPDGKMLYYTSARIKGFYKRDQQGPAIDYDGLLKEMQNIFNRNSNILMIPINLGAGYSGFRRP
jgi:Tol biopolymer transport system component